VSQYHKQYIYKKCRIVLLMVLRKEPVMLNYELAFIITEVVVECSILYAVYVTRWNKLHGISLFYWLCSFENESVMGV